MDKCTQIIVTALPIIVMVLLIPFIRNDYILTLIYSVFILGSLHFKREPRDVHIFIFGFFCMIFFETIFIRTGVETFLRTSLFGIMPLWLPFLWGCGFIAIKRGVMILNK